MQWKISSLFKKWNSKPNSVIVKKWYITVMKSFCIFYNLLWLCNKKYGSRYWLSTSTTLCRTSPILSEYGPVFMTDTYRKEISSCKAAIEFMNRDSFSGMWVLFEAFCAARAHWNIHKFYHVQNWSWKEISVFFW